LKTIVIHMDDELKMRLDRYRQQGGYTISGLVRALLRKELSKPPPRKRRK